MVITASPEMLLTILVLLILGILVIVVWLVNYIAGPSVKKKSKGKRPSVQFSLEPLEPSPTAGDAKKRRSLPMGADENAPVRDFLYRLCRNSGATGVGEDR